MANTWVLLRWIKCLSAFYVCLMLALSLTKALEHFCRGMFLPKRSFKVPTLMLLETFNASMCDSASVLPSLYLDASDIWVHAWRKEILQLVPPSSVHPDHPPCRSSDDALDLLKLGHVSGTMSNRTSENSHRTSWTKLSLVKETNGEDDDWVDKDLISPFTKEVDMMTLYWWIILSKRAGKLMLVVLAMVVFSSWLTL